MWLDPQWISAPFGILSLCSERNSRSDGWVMYSLCQSDAQLPRGEGLKVPTSQVFAVLQMTTPGIWSPASA